MVHLNKINVLRLIFTFAIFTAFISAATLAQNAPVLAAAGDTLPSFKIHLGDNPSELAYLGIKSAGDYSPADIKADLLMIEILSIYCVSCQAEAPYMNKLYAKIESDPSTAGKVKMIGIGAGNSILELASFRDNFAVRYPLFPDDNFDIHTLMGEPRTPFMVFAKSAGGGKMTIVKTHLGLLKDTDALFAIVSVALATGISNAGQTVAAQPRTDLAMPISEIAIVAKVKQSMAAAGIKNAKLTKITLSESDTVYAATAGKKKVFSRVMGRRVPCNDCHNIFFIYTFDDKGKYLDFAPILVTKLGNKEWSSTDINKFKTRLKKQTANMSLLKQLVFDPKVDAVTSATISSKLVYDSLNNTKDVYDKLAEMGYFPKQRK
jgi:hypothetical protein